MTATPALDSTPAAALSQGPLSVQQAEPANLAALTRPDFPLLAQTACLGQPLIYLDHAATSQKPRQVLAALQHYYDHDNANVHRGAHQLSARATEGFEGARAKTAAFVGAASPNEVVFTRNATEAVNVALAVHQTAQDTGLERIKEAEALELLAFQKRREAEEYFALARISELFRKAE